MKILHVIHSVDPRSGGPSHALRQLIPAQVKSGHQIGLLATTAQSAEPWEPRNVYKERMFSDRAFSGADVYLGYAFGRRGLSSRYAFTPDCARWLRRTLSDHQRCPQVVHIHGVFSHITQAAAAYARRYSVPYVLRIAGTLDARCMQMGRSWMKRLFFRLWLRKDLEQAACIHATSRAEAEELRHWVPEERIRVVPHGIKVPEANGSDVVEGFLTQFPQLRGKRIILFMSRVAAKKRPELIVSALSRLRQENDNIALLIAGNDAGHMPAVEAAVRQHRLENAVTCAGFLQGKDKLAALSVADVFVLPSVDENFGVAVVEAMAHGVPVLVTPGVATHVYVDESGGGLTVDGNPEAVAEGIRTLLDTGSSAMGDRGREFVRQHLSWPSIIKQLDDLYRDVLA